MLVTAILVLLILVVIGIAATTTSIFESRIAGTDKVHKLTFYEADGGTEVGSELVEQSASCPGGFKKDGDDADTGNPYRVIEGELRLTGRRGNLNLWQSPLLEEDNILFTAAELAAGITTTDILAKLDTDPDAYWPDGYTGKQEHTNVLLGSRVQLMPGSALQQLAGYEGKGKAAAQGGAARLYDIYSKHWGKLSSASAIQIQWRHVIGIEGDCQYGD